MVIEVKGESLQQIAAKYQTTVEHLQSINRIKTVRPGMRLWIDGAIRHVVAPHETIQSIAGTWSVDVESIARSDATPIRVGQVLTIKL